MCQIWGSLERATPDWNRSGLRQVSDLLPIKFHSFIQAKMRVSYTYLGLCRIVCQDVEQFVINFKPWEITKKTTTHTLTMRKP